MKLARSKELRFQYDSGLEVHVPALSRSQMEKLIELEVGNPAQGPEAMAMLRGEMLAVLITDATRLRDPKGRPWKVGKGSVRRRMTRQDFLDSLSAEEEIDILNAMVVQWWGHDPRSAVQVQQALRQIFSKIGTRPLTPEQALEAHQNATFAIAARIGQPAEDVDRMGYVDSLRLLEKVNEQDHAERAFDASLHDKKLRR